MKIKERILRLEDEGGGEVVSWIRGYQITFRQPEGTRSLAEKVARVDPTIYSFPSMLRKEIKTRNTARQAASAALWLRVDRVVLMTSRKGKVGIPAIRGTMTSMRAVWCFRTPSRAIQWVKIARRYSRTGKKGMGAGGRKMRGRGGKGSAQYDPWLDPRIQQQRYFRGREEIPRDIERCQEYEFC
eukprot:1317615-Amorphochlora_amoeboformis.AAC.1